MGTIKERNCWDLAETEEIKERWKEYTEELYKKELVIHDDVVSYPEPDILEREVKQALGEALLSIKLMDAMEFQ